MIEERKTITNYQDYDVSSLWNIRSYKAGKIPILLKVQKDWGWYSIINLCKNGKVKTHTIHRLLAKEFIPNLENKPEINHKNWIKSENTIDNIEWCTKAYNMKHRHTHLWLKWPKSWLWKFWWDHWSSKSIIQYDLLWRTIKNWWSITDAAKVLCLNKHCISKVCNWNQMSHGWRKRSFNLINNIN